LYWRGAFARWDRWPRGLRWDGRGTIRPERWFVGLLLMGCFVAANRIRELGF
jgi:hypothetical protein